MFSTIRGSIQRQVASTARAFSTTTTASQPRTWLPIASAALAATGMSAYYFSTSSASAESAKAALNGDNQWVDLKLVEAKDLSKNTKAFRFALPSDEYVLGLETAGCVLTKFTGANGKPVIRPYTPVSDPAQKGYVEFVIKVYQEGNMSKHIFGLKPNDTLAFKGPIQKYKWTPNLHKQIGLLGAGTGITPLYQLMHAIDSNPEDKTKVTLFYGNLTDEDILIKDKLDAIAKKKPDQFKIHYFIDKPTSNWEGNTGYITKDYLAANLFSPKEDNVKVFVCGPPPFYKAVSGNKVSPTDQGELTGSLAELGFTKDQVFKF